MNAFRKRRLKLPQLAGNTITAILLIFVSMPWEIWCGLCVLPGERKIASACATLGGAFGGVGTGIRCHLFVEAPFRPEENATSP
eukprot:m.15909 g.15909  ORF g.15909 m.15909 type:complete len:84 (+) comp26620_c0_seq2:346-597(+)